MPEHSLRQAAQIRQALLDGAELALIDVREEAHFATAHPLFAANLPLSKLELEISRRVPRLTTPITVYDNGEGLAIVALERLREWGYRDVALLDGGWRAGSAAAESCFRTSTPRAKRLASWLRASATRLR